MRVCAGRNGKEIENETDDVCAGQREEYESAE
jgi:hypothetical protein